MRNRLIITTTLLVAFAGVTSCGSDSSPSTSSAAADTTKTAQGLTGSNWTLTSFAGSGGQSTPAATGATASLTFGEDGQLSGSTGCNQFSGTYAVDGQKLTITLGPMTLVACADPAVDAQEKAIKQLPTVTAYTATSDTLTLTDSGGATLFVYGAVATTVSGTSWTVTGVNNGKGGVESTALTEKLTATFAANGDFSGFGGCNQLSGTYTTTGTDGLTFSPLIATRKSCGTDVDALETQYSTALSEVNTYQIDGDTLTMRDDTGATQVTARLTP